MKRRKTFCEILFFYESIKASEVKFHNLKVHLEHEVFYYTYVLSNSIKKKKIFYLIINYTVQS